MHEGVIDLCSPPGSPAGASTHLIDLCSPPASPRAADEAHRPSSAGHRSENGCCTAGSTASIGAIGSANNSGCSSSGCSSGCSSVCNGGLACGNGGCSGADPSAGGRPHLQGRKRPFSACGDGASMPQLVLQDLLKMVEDDAELPLPLQGGVGAPRFGQGAAAAAAAAAPVAAAAAGATAAAGTNAGTASGAFASPPAPAPASAAASAYAADEEVREVSPPRPSMRADPLSSMDKDDELECVGVSGSNALVDMPHLREHCLLHPFGDKKRAIERCAKCYCYVCDMLASTCPQWRSHCRAHSSKKPWQAKKLALKDHNAALAAAGQAHVAAPRTLKQPTPAARHRPGVRPGINLISSSLPMPDGNIFSMPDYAFNHAPVLARQPDRTHFPQPRALATPILQPYSWPTPQIAPLPGRDRHARAHTQAHRASLPRVRALDGLPPLPPPTDARPSSALEEQRLYAATHRTLVESGLRPDHASSAHLPPHGLSL